MKEIFNPSTCSEWESRFAHAFFERNLLLYILNQALKGGITAAVVTLAIQLVPILIELLSALVKEKKITSSQLKQYGMSILSAGSKGFIIGGLSCGIYTACKIGKLGAGLSIIHPGVMGTLVALAFNVMMESFEYARGKTDTAEYKYKITRDLLISGAAIAGGSIAVAALPLANALSFVIGSMAGSVIASVTLSISERILVSVCVNSGYSLFGLVNQDYVLPDEYFKGMGLNLAELGRIEPNVANLSISSPHCATVSVAKLSTVNIKILKRGLISFHTVGYVF